MYVLVFMMDQNLQLNWKQLLSSTDYDEILQW